MRSSRTCFGPKARTASAAQTPESTPPETPSTAPRRPSSRTASRMPVARALVVASRSRASGSVAVGAVTLSTLPGPCRPGHPAPGQVLDGCPTRSDRCMTAAVQESTFPRRSASQWHPAARPRRRGDRPPAALALLVSGLPRHAARASASRCSHRISTAIWPASPCWPWPPSRRSSCGSARAAAASVGPCAAASSSSSAAPWRSRRSCSPRWARACCCAPMPGACAHSASAPSCSRSACSR